MPNFANEVSRRDLLKLGGMAAVAARVAQGGPAKTAALFDGKTLEGWIQIENSATSLSSGGITDTAAFASKLAKGSDAVSTFLRAQLQESVKTGLASYSAA